MSFVIQGVPVKTMTHHCIVGDEELREQKSQWTDVSVYVTNACNASCKFCCNKNNKSFSFDFRKFKAFIDELVGKIEVNKITFTGGESSLNITQLIKCVEYTKPFCNNITVITNGTDLASLDHPFIDNISVSRHHYDDEKNKEIFGVSHMDALETFSRKDRVNLSCNLIKGYVDCEEEIYKYLEYMSRVGIESTAFVGLMPVNQYCKDNYVDLHKMKFNERVLKYKTIRFKEPGVCRCNNYVYLADNEAIIEFYTRHNMCPNYQKGSLVVYKFNEVFNIYPEK